MKHYYFDQYEFDDSGSEETITFWQAHSKFYKSVLDFLIETLNLEGVARKQIKLEENWITLSKLDNCGPLWSYIEEKCHIKLSGTEKVHVFCAEWNSLDVLIKYKHYYVRYCWETSA